MSADTISNRVAPELLVRSWFDWLSPKPIDSRTPLFEEAEMQKIQVGWLSLGLGLSLFAPLPVQANTFVFGDSSFNLAN
jgi:hypothetical protein